MQSATDLTDAQILEILETEKNYSHMTQKDARRTACAVFMYGFGAVTRCGGRVPVYADESRLRAIKRQVTRYANDHKEA